MRPLTCTGSTVFVSAFRIRFHISFPPNYLFCFFAKRCSSCCMLCSLFPFWEFGYPWLGRTFQTRHRSFARGQRSLRLLHVRVAGTEDRSPSHLFNSKMNRVARNRSSHVILNMSPGDHTAPKASNVAPHRHACTWTSPPHAAPHAAPHRHTCT